MANPWDIKISIEQLKKDFAATDTDGSGKITREELANLFKPFIG